MEIYKAFLVLLLFVVMAEAPRKKIPKKAGPSTDHIPIYDTPTSTTYKLETLPDGWFMQFYSNDLYSEKPTSNGKDIVRDGHPLSLVQNVHYHVDQGVHFMDAIHQTAKDHIKFYADYWHGKMNSKNEKAYKITEDQIKQLRSDSSGTTYQLESRMKTTDGSLQMCCNMIINVRWVHGITYSYHCGEAACYRINQRLDEEPCFYLDIIPGTLDSIHYKSCMKETHKSHHPTSQSITTTTTTPGHNHHHGVPHHSSSVYAKTCQYEDRVPVDVTFLSKNLDLDGVILAYPKITRGGRLISFTKDTQIVDKAPMNEHNLAMLKVAMSHIEVYADVMHGIRNQRHIVTIVEKKNVGAATDMIYQLNTNVRSSDAPHNEMCCNVLLHTKWHKVYEYEPFCAQVACYEPMEGVDKTCSYLNIEHQINKRDFKSCWKEVK